ncbi:aminoglycoside phosphotransferase family protein [Candidatus Woesearchaeota archaeon]|nr:aminoglycoside phosphotransferase family protein [Candidatus Woesearchaeota archaeon]MCF7901485.1 aminoglycoside phosphotransferase family protein [Candidatus Woesearchaeota archaeon]MCF8013182.1 aminoglycoside phosphotransferase family protein [Candidatus Woesearchaeota archaeon]
MTLIKIYADDLNGNRTHKYTKDGKNYYYKSRTDDWKIKGEIIASKLLKNKIKVPEPFDYGFGETSYLSYEELPGQSLDISGGLIKQAGDYLAKIHSVKFPSAGRIDLETLTTNGKKWNSFFRSIWNYDVALLKNTEFEPEAIRMANWLDEHMVREDYSLIHVDYSKKNILAEEDISGIIDFELCCSGDSIYDVSWSLLNFSEGLPGSNLDKSSRNRLKFLEGYFNEKIPETFEDLVRVYSVAHLARIMRVDVYLFKERLNSKEFYDYKETLKSNVFKLIS